MNKLIKKLKSIPKGYFTLMDVKKITSFADDSLSVAMSRLARSGEIIRISKGIYSVDSSQIDWENFACEVYSPSYISFESALAMHNILSQRPTHITMATSNRSKQLIMESRNIIYHHIKRDLFWGYKLVDGALLADEEKSLLDLLYLSMHGYAKFDSEEMNLKLLNKTRLNKYLKEFDIPQMNKVIDKLRI
ncbi:MAG: hypothetical protein AAB723_04120 [Patescibacteria group bacterium]|mgnify:CR=1 FL=1